MTIISETIPLETIAHVSPLNPRVDVAPDVDIPRLARSIMATKGPAQPMVLRGTTEADVFEVLIGRRRWFALKHIAEHEGIRPTFLDDLPVEVFHGTDAEAKSLCVQEQLNRRSLTPVEQVLEFPGLVLQGFSIADVARDFDLTPREVEQRLALGGLHPKILTAWGDGSLRLDAAQAFAGVADKETQIKVFDAAPEWRGTPSKIRAMMRGDLVAADTALARFVGEAAYVAAGGRVEADLFSDDAWWHDKAIAVALATDKLIAAGERIKSAEGWKWVANDFNANTKRADYRFAEDAQQKWTDADEARFDECAVIVNGGQGTPIEIAAALAEASELETRSWTRGMPAARRRKLGCWVGFDQYGDLDVDRGLEDIPVVEERQAGGEGGRDDGERATVGEVKPIKGAVVALNARAQLIADTRVKALRHVISNHHRLCLALSACGIATYTNFIGAEIDKDDVAGDDELLALVGRPPMDVLRDLATFETFKLDDLTMRAMAASLWANAREAQALENIARTFGAAIDQALQEAFDHAAWCATLDKAECKALIAEIAPGSLHWPSKIDELRAMLAEQAGIWGWLPPELRAPVVEAPVAEHASADAAQ
jgi:ParB-like chromosome segregation protein Spo0J